MEVLLTSRKPKFYCAVTLSFLLLGILSVWLGLLFFVAQMLGTVFGVVILTLLYYEDKGFTHDLGSNGDRVGWSYGKALVGEFRLTFLLVFTVLQMTANSDFDFSSMASFAICLAVFLAHSLLIPIDGAPSIRPDPTFPPFSTCGAFGLDHGPLPQLQLLFLFCSVLVELSLHRALFVSVAWNSHHTAGHTDNASSTTTINESSGLLSWLYLFLLETNQS